jgi:hypothetical protein
MNKEIKKSGYFLMLFVLITVIVSCNSNENSNTKKENNKIRTEENNNSQKEADVDTIVSLKADVENCLAKAISLIEGVHYEHKYKNGERLYFVKNPGSKRMTQLMKTLDKKTSHFNIKKFPKKITVDFVEHCYWRDDEWNITINKNRMYQIKNYNCRTGDLDPDCDIEFNFDLKSNTYKAKFSVSSFNQEEEYEEYIFTVIEIKNDIISSYKCTIDRK